MKAGQSVEVRELVDPCSACCQQSATAAGIYLALKQSRKQMALWYPPCPYAPHSRAIQPVFY
jgi:hypothetical protein